MDMWWKIKPYISKIRNGFSLCIYDLEFSWFYTFQFLHPIIHLTTTTKKKKKPQMDMWRKIGLQLKSNLESNCIQTL